MTDFDDEAAWLLRVMDDLDGKQRRQGNLVIELPALSVLQLAGLMLLVQRHTADVASRGLADAILRMTRTFFEDCAEVLAVLDAGADPSADRPIGRSAPLKTRH